MVKYLERISTSDNVSDIAGIESPSFSEMTQPLPHGAPGRVARKVQEKLERHAAAPGLVVEQPSLNNRCYGSPCGRDPLGLKQ